jgi:hypothetical protein
MASFQYRRRYDAMDRIMIRARANDETLEKLDSNHGVKQLVGPATAPHRYDDYPSGSTAVTVSIANGIALVTILSSFVSVPLYSSQTTGP